MDFSKQYPLKDETFSVYEHVGGANVEADRLFVAFFSSHGGYPLYFHGPTFEKCLERAEEWRKSTVLANEKLYLTKLENLKKGWERKQRKKDE